ncbi:hypothetical protein H4219_005627 [Mycoemilia scoparia]|uniref:Uncharacterized protein n=1 Tax=Mycoemilia scoparia TaxID=417184 RepID=A0A9W8DNY1_9FUNG|nr:hypothetical protein H4219_005627 [Mycoemilia scoparia]
MRLTTFFIAALNLSVATLSMPIDNTDSATNNNTVDNTSTLNTGVADDTDKVGTDSNEAIDIADYTEGLDDTKGLQELMSLFSQEEYDFFTPSFGDVDVDIQDVIESALPEGKKILEDVLGDFDLDIVMGPDAEVQINKPIAEKQNWFQKIIGDLFASLSDSINIKIKDKVKENGKGLLPKIIGNIIADINLYPTVALGQKEHSEAESNVEPVDEPDGELDAQPETDSEVSPDAEPDNGS